MSTKSTRNQMSSIDRNIILFLDDTSDIEVDLTNCCTYISSPHLKHSHHLFLAKTANRNLKTLYQVDANLLAQIGVKRGIKLLTEWGFDGILVTNVSPRHKYIICKFFETLDKLPPPYDFLWTKCIRFANNASKKETLKTINDTNILFLCSQSCVRSLTDCGIENKQILIEMETDDSIELVKYVKLGGLFTNNYNNGMIAYNQLEHTIQDKSNNLDYPTSSFVREIQQSDLIDDIINDYQNETTIESNSVVAHKQVNSDHITVVLDIDFI